MWYVAVSTDTAPLICCEGGSVYGWYRPGDGRPIAFETQEQAKTFIAALMRLRTVPVECQVIDDEQLLCWTIQQRISE